MSPRPRHFTAEMGILRMLLVLFTSFLYTPLTSALGTGHMSYPDGSECWACFADDFSCVTHMYGPGFISTCPISATACGGAQVPDGYVQTPLDGDFRVCASLNGCVHDCVTSVGLNYLVETCCFKEGSQYIRDFYINGLDQSQLSPLNQPAPSSTIIPKAPQGTSGPSSTTSSEPQVIEGKGVGISCSLVQSASAAYNSAISAAAAGGSASSSTLLSYYSQALHIACLRSSPLCKVQECVEVEATLKAAPTGCKEGGDEHLGSDFEEEIFAGLIQGSGFGDIQGRQAKVDSAIQDLVGKVNGGDVGSPFLNLMLGIGADGDNAPDTAKLVEGYYGTVQVFDDMQPLFEKYIQSKLGGLESDNLSALMKTVDDLARSHSQLLKCGVAPSFGGQAEPNTNSNTAGTSLQTNGTLPAAAAAAASLFVPFVAAQLRNDKIIQALLPPRTPDSNKNATGIDIAALSKLLNARLPISPTLQVDTRNWLYPSLKPGDSSNGNPNSEAFSLLEQALIKQELSNEAGSDFEITTELHAIMDLVISSRTNKKLSDFMATMAMFFPTTNGTQAYKPTRITAAGKIYPVIGPVGVIFPAATELIPGYSPSTNITSVDTSSTEKNGFAAGAGGALTPVAPTDADIASVLYSTATLRMHIDPAHYVDAKPKITNPGAQFYILDLVSGKEIPSKYSVQSTGGEDREGNPMEFGVLEATIEYGSGIWAGGWGGGGAFAVAVRDWVEAQSGAVERWSWERNSWGIVMVVGWTAAVVYLAGVVV